MHRDEESPATIAEPRAVSRQLLPAVHPELESQLSDKSLRASSPQRRHRPCKSRGIAGVSYAASTHSAHNMPLEVEINARLRHLSREIRRFREEAAELRRGPSRGHSERTRSADDPYADSLGPSAGGPSHGTPQH